MTPHNARISSILLAVGSYMHAANGVENILWVLIQYFFQSTINNFVVVS